MGDFRIVVEATGGHGCQREVTEGGHVYGCGMMSCPDCIAREFVEALKRRGNSVFKAELVHWPHDVSAPGRSYTKEGEVRDDLLTRIRSGSFKALVFLLALLPFAALAQVAEPVSVPDAAATLMELLGDVVLAVVVLLGFGGLHLAKVSEDRKRMIASFIDLAYGAVAELARKSATQIDDKAALGLKKLAELLRAQGQKPPAPGEVAVALARFDTLHATEKATERALAAAASPQ